MSKSNLIKKFVLYAFVIIYDIVSLFWCYILVKSLIFEFSTVKIGLNGIDIIGGADIPTLIYKIGNVIGVVFPILFVLLSVAITFLFTVSIFKKQTNRKLNILLCIFLVLSLIVFIFISTQAYVVSLYVLVRKLSFLKYLPILYVIVSLLAIIANALISKKR